MSTKKIFFAGKYYGIYRISLGMISFTVLFLFFISCDELPTEKIGEWKFLGLEGKLVNDLKLIDNYLYACAGKDGLYKLNLNETNNSWKYLGLKDDRIEKTLEAGVTDVISMNGNLIVSYAAGAHLNYKGIYRSSDKGNYWIQSDSGMINTSTSNIIRLYQLPNQSQTLFALSSINIVYISSNGGLTWGISYGSIGASSINYAVISNPLIPTEIFVGGESGRFAPYLLRSIDDGISWSNYILFPPYFGPYFVDNVVYDLAFDPIDGSKLYAGMLGVIGKTTDKGETFQRILGWEDGIYRNWRIAINPHNPKDIFSTGFYLYRTQDGGQTWEKIKPPYFEIYALAINWQQRILYISVSSPENGIYMMRF